MCAVTPRMLTSVIPGHLPRTLVRTRARLPRAQRLSTGRSVRCNAVGITTTVKPSVQSTTVTKVAPADIVIQYKGPLAGGAVVLLALGMMMSRRGKGYEKGREVWDWLRTRSMS